MGPILKRGWAASLQRDRSLSAARETPSNGDNLKAQRLTRHTKEARRAGGLRRAKLAAKRSLVVDRLLLEVGLGVVAHRADLGGLGAHVQVAAVAALPHLHALAGEDLALLHALGKL